MKLFGLAAVLSTLSAEAWTESDSSGASSSPEYFTVMARSQGSQVLRLHRFATGEVLWAAELESWRSGGGWPPYIDRGRVIAVGRSAGLCAMDLRTGRRLWSVDAPRVEEWSPSGETLYYATPTEIVCLDSATGQMRWKRESGAAHGSFLRSGSRLFAVSSTGRLEALNGADGSQLWKFEEGVLPGYLAVHGGGVITGAGRGGKVLYLDERTSEQKWAIESFGEKCGPAVRGGRLYVTNYRDSFRRIDPETGAEFWRFNDGGWIEAAAGPHLFVQNLKGRHSCVDGTTGHPLWSLVQGASSISSKESAFLLKLVRESTKSTLTAFDPSCDAVHWSRPVTWTKIHPVVADHGVYVCIQERPDSSSVLYGLNRKTGVEAWSARLEGQFGRVSVVDRRLLVTLADSLVGIEASTGKTLWKVRCDPCADPRIWSVHPSPRVFHP